MVDPSRTYVDADGRARGRRAPVAGHDPRGPHVDRAPARSSVPTPISSTSWSGERSVVANSVAREVEIGDDCQVGPVRVPAARHPPRGRRQGRHVRGAEERRHRRGHQGAAPLLRRRRRDRRRRRTSGPARSPPTTTASTSTRPRSATACTPASTRRWSRRSSSATDPRPARASVVTHDVPAGPARQRRARAGFPSRRSEDARGCGERATTPRLEAEADGARHQEEPHPGGRARPPRAVDGGRPAPARPARRRRALDVRERRDLLPLRREHPRRRRVRVPVARRPDQRPADGAADHDRRREARVGQAHHRGVARSTATRARTARPRAASRSPRASSPTCSPSPAPTAS